MFVGKARAYRRVEHLKVYLGYRGLPRTNTLAYYENLQIMAVKSFIMQAPGCCHLKFLTKACDGGEDLRISGPSYKRTFVYADLRIQ
jgi:hypothetical protein